MTRRGAGRTWTARANRLAAALGAALMLPGVAMITTPTPTAGAFSRAGLPIEIFYLSLIHI